MRAARATHEMDGIPLSILNVCLTEAKDESKEKEGAQKTERPSQ